MANIPIKSIQFPDLPDTYTFAQIDDTLTKSGEGADAKVVGDRLAELPSAEDVYNAFVTENLTGSIASFDDGADDIPVKSLVAEIVPLQSGSGDPSPDNVRAISGWTEANITVCSVNLFSGVKDLTGTNNGVTFTYDGTGKCSIVRSSSASSASAIPSVSQFPTVHKYLKAGTYTLSCTKVSGSGTANAQIYDDNITLIAQTNDAPITFTLSEGKYVTCRGIVRPDESPNGVWAIQLQTGSTATAYEPYNGSTHTISWQTQAGTVYVGRLAIHYVDGELKCELTVTHAMWTKNTSAMNNNPDYPGWNPSGIKDIIGGGYNQAFGDQIINVGSVFAVNTNASNDILYLPKNAYNNLTQNDWISRAVDIQIVAELATPQTYQLTPTEVKTLLGNNNVWADTGDVDLTYRADLGLYLDKIINA